MDAGKIERLRKLNSEIENFKVCYDDCKLWGSSPDGDVKMDAMLEWLINNPHMADIAKAVNKLDK